MKATIAEIDALLPQTQCRQCSYNGCLPYATAIINAGETIDRCVPGGVKTLAALGQQLGQDYEPLIPNVVAQESPLQLAVIREAECIGCTKCIQACPIDAIIGSAKQLHSVLSAECTGCGLCVAPCPVDCIDLVPVPALSYQPLKAKQRFEARNLRLAKNKRDRDEQPAPMTNPPNEKQAYIAAALARVKLKRAKDS